MTYRKVFDIYVSNFTHKIQQMKPKELEQLLETVAGVQCVRLSPKGSYCFFRVQGKENFEKALENLSKSKVDGRKLVAQETQPRENRRLKTKQNYALAETLQELAKEAGLVPSLLSAEFHVLERAFRTVYVGNTPEETGEAEMEAYFSQFGEIERVNMVADGSRPHAGYGFVVYRFPEDARTIISSSKQFFLLGELLRVQLSRPSPKVFRDALVSGLIHEDGRETALFLNLLNVANAKIGRKSTSPSNKTKYLQDQLTGFVYAVPENQLDMYLSARLRLVSQEDLVRHGLLAGKDNQRAINNNPSKNPNQVQMPYNPQQTKKFSQHQLGRKLEINTDNLDEQHLPKKTNEKSSVRRSFLNDSIDQENIPPSSSRKSQTRGVKRKLFESKSLAVKAPTSPSPAALNCFIQRKRPRFQLS